MPTLIEVGARVINVAFMIMSERIGAAPDLSSEVEVTMAPGVSFKLSGDDARRWISILRGLVPAAARDSRAPAGPVDPQSVPRVTRARRKGRAAEKRIQ